VQQGRGTHNFEIGALSLGYSFSHAIDAQDVVETMHGVILRVPGTGSFDVWHK